MNAGKAKALCPSIWHFRSILPPNKSNYATWDSVYSHTYHCSVSSSSRYASCPQTSSSISHIPCQFPIHADFIASANRESLVDCAWNVAISRGVATAFTKAVETFATTDHPLRYSWLDYLPFMPVEKPWKHLYSSIVDILKTKSVLETWEQRQFKKPPQLRQLATCCLFKDQPLLGDLKDEMYLASDYRHKRTKTLEDLGVYTMTWNEVMIRIQAHLTSQSSRIKIKKRDSPWYEAFAQLGLLALQGESSGISEWFKRQPLICLSQANQWTGAPNMGYGGLKNI